jgi:peptidoglycan/LPS O-acetylase OafA/YrhL
VKNFWSLSVEEQFYFLLPFGIAGAGLTRHHRRLAVNIMLTAIAIASFAWAQRSIRISEPSAFYLFQNRMWQFALGGLLGVNFESAQRIPALARAAAADRTRACGLGSRGLRQRHLPWSMVNYPDPWRSVTLGR